jgi:signal transduction histidine kinase/ligand-binding sensor domain-containing protein
MIKLTVARRPGLTGALPALLALLNLFPAAQGWAQQHSLDVSQYLHTSWTAEEGYFPGSGVTNHGIAQTSDGYLWILSSTGLFRFDGARFLEWTPPKGEPFPGSPPSQLLASSDGSLWIGGHGVAQLTANGTWHPYPELDSLSRVRLGEDKNGVIWVGAEKPAGPEGYSLYRLDQGKFAAYKQPDFVGLALFPLFSDRQGRFWVDSDKGIWRILPGPPHLVLKKPAPTSDFSEDSSGGLLYENQDRIRKLSADGSSEDYLDKLQKHPLIIRTMMLDREGDLWIGTRGQGIVHLHEGRIDRFTSLDGLSSDVVESVYEDHEGNVWVATPRSIEKFSKPAVARLTRKQGLSGDSTFSVLRDQHQRTWIGTADGFNVFAGDQIVRPNPQLPNDPGLALIETKAGRLLMTTGTRNAVSTRRSGHLVPGVGGGSWLEGYGNIFSLIEGSDGTLWAVSQQLGLLHLRENGDLIEAVNDAAWGDYALSVALDRTRDGIWFTTHNGKVFFLKSGKIIEHYGRDNGIPEQPVRVVQVDDDGAVWLTGTQGLMRLMHHQVTTLGVRNGLPCERIHWMRRDQDHQVWLYTVCGLLSFSGDDLSAWIAEPSHRIEITHRLDNTEGVESTSVSPWYSPMTGTTADGRILFAMRSGVGVFDPRHLGQNDLPPPVYIEDITADGQPIARAAQTALPARTGAIHITYTALSFVAPRRVQFRYRLKGYDSNWSAPVSLREVTYTKLPPANYQFQVIACNNNGVWNTQGASLNFFVAPAWYQTLWFRALVVLAALGLLSALYLTRISLIRREIHLRFEGRMTERMRIARELHDTLLQSLQGLILNFSNFSMQATAPPEVRKEIEDALDRAELLVISGRARIQNLRGESAHTGDFASALSAAVEGTSREFGSKFKLTIEGTPRPLNEALQDETVWVVLEALANVRNHSGASAIELLVSFHEKEFRVAIIDNGRGFDPRALVAAHSGHFGLIGMRERAEAMGGHLRVDSSSGKGTTVELTVPGNVAHKKPEGWLRQLLSRLLGDKHSRIRE